MPFFRKGSPLSLFPLFSALRKLPVHDPVVHDGRGEGDALEPPGRGFQNVFRGDHEVRDLAGLDGAPPRLAVAEQRRVEV